MSCQVHKNVSEKVIRQKTLNRDFINDVLTFFWREVELLLVCVYVCVSCVRFVVMRCAERTGSAMMVWQHEFYMVIEIEPDPSKPSGAPLPYVYQAVDFKLGSNLDPKV